MKSRLNQLIPLGVGIVVVFILIGIGIVDSTIEKEMEEQLVSRCSPILSEFDRIQEVRNEKRRRFETLLVKQEQGLIPFDSQVVDYEYRAWMIQETELDHRGDDLIQRMRLLDCSPSINK